MKNKGRYQKDLLSDFLTCYNEHMNLILHLTPEIEARLSEQAKAEGKTPEEIAVAALQSNLAETAKVTHQTLPLESWLKAFDAWVAGHESRNPRLDDSRESMYPDRW